MIDEKRILELVRLAKEHKDKHHYFSREIVPENLSVEEEQILATEFMIARYYYPDIIDSCIFCTVFNSSEHMRNNTSCKDCPWTIFLGGYIESYDDYFCVGWANETYALDIEEIASFPRESIVWQDRVEMLQDWHTKLLDNYDAQGGYE